MKTIKALMRGVIGTMAILSLMLSACSDTEESRAYEGVQIVGVKVNNELFTPTYKEGETIISIPAGRDLTKAKLHLLVANGEVANFVNEAEYDCRKPMALTLQGYNGSSVDMKLRVQSPPKLVSFIIEGLTIPNEDLHTSSTSLIVQVPPSTDLTALKVTMEFSNGTLINFENGIVQDYTAPVSFNVMGADAETVYPYDFMITTETVGPASVKAMKISGIVTDSVVNSNNNLTAYVPSLMNFTSVDVELTVGFGNRVDATFTGKGLNLMAGNNKVKVTGTNGIETEFTLTVPQLSFKPLFAKKYSELGFGANDLCSTGFSGQYVLAGNYTSATKTPVYYNFAGEKQGSISATGVDPTGYGFRKFATDEKGAILALSLGMSAGDQWVYKWDNVSGQGQKYLSFSKAALGTSYSPRSAGINISGSLDGNAIITMGMAQQTDIFVWTVTGGVLNPTPQKFAFPYTGTSYYWSIVPMPIGMGGFLGMATANNVDFNNGILCLSPTMGETQKLTGFITTDGKVIKYKERVYLAFTVYANNTTGVMRICDITDGQLASYKTPIFDRKMVETGANGNATMDADITIIDGKLYVAFASTSHGFYLYCFDK